MLGSLGGKGVIVSHPPVPAKERETGLAEACRDLARVRGERRSADAEDVAQDACLRALQVDAPDKVRDPVRYVLRIARNLVVDRLRQRNRESLVLNSLAAIDFAARDPVDPERILAGKQELERVLAEIERLPPRCREAFTLHRFKGLSYAGIARHMGVSTSMVEKHIAEAMLRIVRIPKNGEYVE
jgi:RNA polymerase sigma-70 factor (ECF subfamily)